ncbi:MAG TPA: hypothetical protein VM124_02665 [Candidatus Limnocylindrales bacterium]|nr:hypothetical protein [Candidatus Limnocylindrales bacterium]
MPLVASLELSLASTIIEEAMDARLETIEDITDWKVKLGARAIHELCIKAPARARRLLSRMATAKGLEYLGEGIEYSVYRPQGEDRVLKVHRSSVYASEPERVVAARRIMEENRLLKLAVGPFLPEQQVDITDHPLIPGRRAIVLEQPYKAIMPNTCPTRINQPQADEEALVRICEFTGVRDALAEFIGRANLGAQTHGRAPDTNGHNNLVLCQGAAGGAELVLVDGQPIPKTIPVVFGLVMSQVDSMDGWLRQVA